MPSFTPADLPGREPYFLLTSLVVPRPIAWVATRSGAGVRNLAPHSYFNIISSNPLVVHVTSSGAKDTLANIRATGEFTISVVDEPLLEAMNTTAVDAPPEVDEFDVAGVAMAPSDTVDIGWVADAPGALECRLRTIVSIGNGNMIFGDVTRIHVADRVWDGERVDPEALRAVGRLAGSNYVHPGAVQRLPRPTWAEIGPTG